MAFNIIKASKNISAKYRRYLKTMFDIKDSEYKKIFDKRLEENKIFEKGPFLDVTNSFSKGKNLKELIEEGVVSKEFEKIERLYKIPSLYHHQEEAIRKAIKGENLIVSTGTGSGKTETFLLPIINELLREKENGTLDDGVRALIIYPMNALANDQIDRLRKTFIDYPDITFGCYTGQTKQYDKSTTHDRGAISQYKELNGKRMDEPRLQNPLKNERLSRDSMKKNPPHILITNYAMLEYLMLRPEDNVFFDGPKANNWKFVVLDEAHTYNGSTGIEVSMLLRRLLAKLNNKNMQFILTSATLGDEKSNDEVVDFANKLTSVEFKKENIIRAKRIDIKEEVTKYELDTNFYLFVNNLIDEGYEDKIIIQKIEEKYNFGIKNELLSEYLYELLIKDVSFWKVKNFITSPKSISDISKKIGWNENEISAFVEVASRASKNGSKLFDSRYHMFLRATEGVFITLAPHKDLFLNRKDKVFVDNEEYKVFEAVTCTQCHSIYLIGFIENDHLVQKSNRDSNEIKEAFYLGETFNDTDEDDTLEESKLEVEQYELCPHCGFIRSSKVVHKKCCNHDEKDFVKLIKVKSTNSKDPRVTKCICCENVNRLGILRGFFSGQEATTSVIGTSLFEELPSHEKRITVKEVEDDGFDIEDDGESEEIVSKAKQFIAFSDSRQAAAYFSSYFSLSYDSILYGRMIKNEMDKISTDSININLFIKNLAASMEENKIIPFDEYLQSLKSHSVESFNYEKIAWQALLKALVDSGSRNSLFGLGLIGIDFNSVIKFGGHSKHNLTAEEVKNICMVFVMSMLSDPAIYYPISMNKAEKEFFTHNGVEISYLKNDGNVYIRSFVPRNDSLSNKRLDYLTKILSKSNEGITRDEVKTLLNQFWEAFFASNKLEKPQIMFKDNEGHYKVNINNFELTKNRKVYRCKKCNKLTNFNVRGVCPSYHCDGELEEVDINELEKNNHYYKLYNGLQIQPLRVVEHTAQLDREEAYNYQNLFKDQKIDVLSCSTTFEMGVDVGELETVFMRNMPPSPSNYAQRAGRAGRSAKSAAFALTFCNKSNHDFNFFDHPNEMINGIIEPPHFKIDNEKISIRHLYSSALSFFFKIHPEFFDTAKVMMETNQITQKSGYDEFELFLKGNSTEKEKLKSYLLDSVPANLHSKFEIETFGWVRWLFTSHNEEYPSLFDVRERYLNEIKSLEDAYEKAKSEGSYQQHYLSKRIKTYEDEKIISFLSRNNILPRYGFPVDTVSLEINVNTKGDDLSGLELNRDLSMAITEYAPGCQIIANNKLITSQYIKKNPGLDWRKYDYVECPHCKTLNVDVSKEGNSLTNCKQCGEILKKENIKTFLIPEFGFIAKSDVEKPTLIKPERTYKTEATFFSYKDSIDESTYNIKNTEVNVSQIGNDGDMIMLNRTDFFVCPHCGYAIEKPSNFGPYAKSLSSKDKHKDARGYYCPNKELERYSLGHKFKTDIVRIKIHSPLLSIDKTYDEAYSILQALILGASRILNIENTEIAGCLQYFNDHNRINYAYILYDTTPGGAGHVKRLNSETMINNLLLKAYSIAKLCSNCDEESSCYSCLRTYQNQKYHDIIKRKYVIDYLEEVLKIK